MAQILKAHGLVIDGFKPKNGKTFELEELQNVVCGYIQIANLANGKLMVMNEEGKLKGLAINMPATRLYNEGKPTYAHDVVVGDVLVCDENEIE